ncbi:MAG: HEPN domain-containing protein [Armatimonadetes bacterium]|nr:HEPN domain-containing protein [Armatimonadota bacterium]
MLNTPKISDIQTYLDDLRTDTRTLRTLEVASKAEYNASIDESTHLAFIQIGDYHYFVARTLFSLDLDHYSFFAAQQCVENYLKAYLRFKRQIPPNTHKLPDLLAKCREAAADSDSFLSSDHCETIALRYNPFNELARYPIQKTRPQGGIFGVFKPYDIYILDYFVFRMKEIMPLPTDNWNILEPEGHQYLQFCAVNHPEILERFQQDNINFEKR